jgi:hypothetical protein
MADLSRENLILLSDPPPSWFPKVPSVSTRYRWAQVGLANKAGKIIKLEVIRIGGAAATSEEAYRRFFAALAGHDGGEAKAKAKRQHDRAEAFLDAHGI